MQTYEVGVSNQYFLWREIFNRILPFSHKRSKFMTHSILVIIDKMQFRENILKLIHWGYISVFIERRYAKSPSVVFL